jgi:hypothetical protein
MTKPTKRNRFYYSLLALEAGRWVIEFGDYDRQVVRDELADYVDRGYRAKNLKIISTADDQASIVAKVAQLNDPASLHSDVRAVSMFGDRS